MSLAPDIDKLGQTIQVKSKGPKSQESTSPKEKSSPMTSSVKTDNNFTSGSFDVTPDGALEFKIFGLGGAGKTAAIRHSMSGHTEAPITTIDTSGVNDKVEGVDSIRIAGLSGRGKLRRDEETLETITNFISDYVAENEFAEVNVMVHSLSGGSGSVIGPMLTDEILKQGKIAIVIGILDQDSEVDTINALNSLRTLDNIAKGRKGYLPVVLFDNNNGRHIVDRGIASTLANLKSLLSLPLIGLDKQDRRRFLQPQSFDGVSTGLKLLNISRRREGDEWGGWEANGQVHPADEGREKVDSMLIISHSEEHLSPKQRCTVTFRGYYEKGEVLIGSLGYQVPAEVIKGLNATIHAHKSQAPVKETKIDADDDYEIGQSRGKLVL